MSTSFPASPYSDLSAVLRALMGEVGGWRVRGLLSQALMWLLYRRLSCIRGQMERLVARFEAGRLSQRGPRAAGCARGAVAGGAARIWPGRFGWLVRLATYQAAGYGAQLRAVLSEPEMVALLAAAPQAARILRPVCRMLAVETSVLRPRAEGPIAEPGVAAPAQPAVAVEKRVRPPRAAGDFGRIALPRGVLKAARRQGFGRGG